MPSPSEIAAYVGAAAWLPQIGSWISERFIPPLVRIIPERQVQLGFTTLGPIFNVRMALGADRKDAVLEHMEVKVQHGQGDVHTFTWAGLRETFSEITDSQGNRQFVERDQPAIALKISTLLLLEKFVRFQDTAYHERHRKPLESVVAHFNYLKSQQNNTGTHLVGSREFHDLLEFYKAEFWWKPGDYTASFAIESSNGARLRPESFRFSLAQHDVDAMRANIDVMRTDYTNAVMSGAEDYQAAPVVWSWRTVPFNPVKDVR